MAERAEDEVLSQQQYVENPFPIDPGAEDWNFPDASDISVPEAVKLWATVDATATEANRRAARLKERRAKAKALALAKIEERRKETGESKATVELDDGREITATPYEWEVFTVVDWPAFRKWAEGQEESYWDPEPTFREGIFLDAMRRRSHDGEPLPPGVTRWTDTRISRSATPKRRRTSNTP